MKKKIIYIIIFLINSYNLFIDAQSKSVRIENFSYQEGLTTSGLNSVYKDSKGFLWLCSSNGLFRYDGYSFKNINAITSGYLKYETYCIAEDKNQNLWIGTAGKGVFFYNTHSGILFNLKLSEGNNAKINWILFFDRKIWLSTNMGLIVVNEVEKIDTSTYLQAKVLWPDPIQKSMQMNVINYIYSRPDSKSLWIGTNSSLYELNTETFHFKLIDSYNQKSIRWISDYEDEKIIVSSWDGGIFIVNSKTGQLENDQFITEINKIVGDKRVKSALMDKNKRCWIATFGEGIYIFEKSKEGNLSYQNYREDGSQALKIKSNFTDQIFLDESGIAWISMAKAGLSKVYFPEKKFHHFSFIQSGSGTQFKEILTVSQSLNKNLFWVNFNQNEIDLFDTKTNKYRQFTSNSPYMQLQNDKVSMVYQDKKGNLWIVYSRIGIYVIPSDDVAKLIKGIATNTIKPIDANSLFHIDPRSNSYTTCFYDDNKGRLWIGGWGEARVLEIKDGFLSSKTTEDLRTNSQTTLVYSQDQKEKYEFTVSPVNSIVQIDKDKYWIGTRDGGIIEFNEIKRLQFVGKNLELNEKLPSANIKCFYFDNKKNLWIGTNSGLCQLNKDEIRTFSTKNGLSSEDINNIIEDKNNNIWVSTFYGISKISKEDFSISNFLYKDKENQDQYFNNAASITPDGMILFSTNESLVYFNPDSIEVAQISAPIYFTDIKINNSTVIPIEKFKGTRIIKSDLNDSKIINVPYGSTLSIEFAALEYTAPQNLLYKYKIGSGEWIMLSPGQRSLNLPNMNPGEYKLEIMVANSSGKKSIRSIKINYLPPFWLSSIAYVIYVFVFLFLLYTYHRLIVQKISQKSLIEKERYEIRKLEEMDKMKSEFFSNISHEFRTPLSLIINPLEKLAKDEDISPNNKDRIRLILKSSNRLLKLTNELMDFSKLEKDLLKPEFQRCEIVSIINEIFILFNNLADSMNIDYKINHAFENLEIPIDKGMVEKAFFNLLSNAFKYTPVNGIIVVNLFKIKEADIEYVKISVINTGEGISNENIDKIFDRYYQVNNVQNKHIEGTGIGLALVKSFIELHKGKVTVKSEPNRETCFDIYLPILQAEYSVYDTINSQIVKKDYSYTIIQDNKYLGTKPASHYNLLLIEDEEDIRNYIIEELSHEYKVLSANNGEEGLNLANETIPDLIITDVMMPVLSGVELCKILKNQVITSHIPIIVLSAKTAINQQIEGLEMGADVYLIKPFNIDYLKAQINRLLSFRQAIYSKYLKETTLIPHDSVTNKLDDEFMRKVMTFIENNLTNSDLNVDQLANCVSLSKVQTYRKIKAISGLSIVEFIRTVRLKKAAQHILEGSLNFSEIAFETGFSSPSYFSKCFHDHYGKTPSEFATEFGSANKQDI